MHYLKVETSPPGRLRLSTRMGMRLGARVQGSGGAEAQERKAVFGWHGQAPLVHADAEWVATGLQKETTQRVVSTQATSNPGVLAANNNPHSKIQNPQSSIRGVALKEHLVGAKIGGITGEQPAVTTVNYFTGNDKSKWKANVPTFNMVNLGEVYQGIELSLKAYSDNVEKLFCVKPGASPEFIKVQVDGSKSLRVNQEGQLEADTELGLVKFTRPIAYQEIEGKRVEVDVEYRLSNQKSTNSDSKNPKSEYGFTVASYDKTKDLIIDPLHASTFLGGSGDERGYSLALDTSGNVYVTGYTWSTDFPTTSGAYDTSYNGADVFVSKLGSTLSAFSISPTSKSFSSEGGTGIVVVTAVSNSLVWTAVSNATWITVTTGGTGSGEAAYSVSANTDSARTGTMTIAGETFTVRQYGGCAYTISPTSQSFTSGGGTGSVSVGLKLGSCSWTAKSNASWITVTSGGSGTGSGTVTYSVSANPGTNARIGTITIAKNSFVVRQDGACAYTISPTSKSFTSGGGTGSVSVGVKSSNCSWTVVSNATWITVTSGGSGTGNGRVTYSVSANTGTSARTGTMTIAGKTFTVKQAK